MTPEAPRRPKSREKWACAGKRPTAARQSSPQSSLQSSLGKRLACGQPTGILGGQRKREVQQPAAGGSRFPRRVRCKRHVFEPRQRVIWADRLVVKHIKRGMGEAARPQRSNECRLINQGTARRVDQDCTLPHQGKTPSIDETARLRDKCKVQAHRISGGKKRIERGGLCRNVRRYARPVPGKDAHA